MPFLDLVQLLFMVFGEVMKSVHWFSVAVRKQHKHQTAGKAGDAAQRLNSSQGRIINRKLKSSSELIHATLHVTAQTMSPACLRSQLRAYRLQLAVD